MIIIGYQGIGKSSLAKGANGFIDLESGNFWVDGVRDKNWAQVYANMAIHLSMQGYNVFTASHKAVRECLKNHPYTKSHDGKAPEILAVCYPALHLMDPWTMKLQHRYEDSKLDKDYKAWMNAKEMYVENIEDLMAEPDTVLKIQINSMDYSLEKELAKFSIFRKGVAAIES